MNILQICPTHLSDVATLPWEIQKSHFSTLLFIYFLGRSVNDLRPSSHIVLASIFTTTAHVDSLYVGYVSISFWRVYLRLAFLCVFSLKFTLFSQQLKMQMQ